MAREVNSVQKPRQYSRYTLMFLSLILGTFGIDRFYLHKWGTGVLKLITIGGLGIWYLYDLVAVFMDNVKDKDGRLIRFIE